jgi:hypothetical protein
VVGVVVTVYTEGRLKKEKSRRVSCGLRLDDPQTLLMQIRQTLCYGNRKRQRQSRKSASDHNFKSTAHPVAHLGLAWSQTRFPLRWTDRLLHNNSYAEQNNMERPADISDLPVVETVWCDVAVVNEDSV